MRLSILLQAIKVIYTKYLQKFPLSLQCFKFNNAMDHTNVINELVSADKSATLFLNTDMGSTADTIFWCLSSRLIWVPIALFFLYKILYTNKRSWAMKIAIVLGLVLCITLCDQIASSVFKPIVARFRPSHDIEISALLHYVNNYHGGNYGFMSSHAANAFGAATFGSLIIRKKYFAISVFSLAVLVSYSRIYLGVHFLGDVVCGAMTGILIAFMIYYLLRILHTWLIFKSTQYNYAWLRVPDSVKLAV